MKPQIFDETHSLEEVLVWGEPGIETLLGQLLPKSKSLFFSYYDVQEARREFRHMRELIEGEGIRFTRAKDALARALANGDMPEAPGSLAELEKTLLARANEYYETHRAHKAEEFAREGVHGDIDIVYEQVREEIRQVLREDVRAYGEAGAIRLNHLLSLSHRLPLANIFYGRDQSQTLADRIVLSSLKWEIRQPEVEVFKRALHELGYANGFVEIGQGVLEGGDVVVLGDTCYIGVGARTTLGAAEDLCLKLGAELERRGIQIAAVINKRHAGEAALFAAPTDEHMHLMHLDMFWIPLAPNLAMGYGGELDRREVLRLTDNRGRLVVEEMGGFREFLSAKGVEIMEVDGAEQQNFATNLLNLGNKTVIVALSANRRVIQELERRGFRVLSAELNKLVNGYGAIHCLTAPVRRKLP
ncbi:MAG: Arginine deiminase [Anaerolineales bacterium]|nr:Arginine deiminase [Anaerolineales bacterium]